VTPPGGARPQARESTPEDLAGGELPRMSLLEHLEELRKRIVYALIALAVAVLGCFAWAREICLFFAQPIYEMGLLPPGQKLAFLGVTDPFVLFFKASLLAGAFLAAPVILYQAWAFISPGLYPKERRWAAPFVGLGWLFFVGGGVFAYLVAFPLAVQFLLEMGKDFTAVITVDRYYGLLLTMVLGMGLMFELPIVLTILARVGLVTPRFLLRNFRWAVLVIFVVAAIITPTSDILNLCVFALPTIALYLLGTAAAWAVTRGKRSEAA
jgi:sec-independent protein translocase protein TatC